MVSESGLIEGEENWREQERESCSSHCAAF